MRIEPSHEIPALDREPQGALLIKYRRVGVTGFRVRHFVFRNFSGARIEFADKTGVISGVPDVAVVIRHQAMWARVARLERVFTNSSGRRIEPAQFVHELFRKPQGAIRAHSRIVRVRVFRGHVPLANGHVQGSDFISGGSGVRDHGAQQYKGSGDAAGQNVDCFHVLLLSLTASSM